MKADMETRIAIITLALLGAFGMTTCRADESGTSSSPGVVQKVEHGVEHAADATGRGLKRAGKATEHGVEWAAHGVERGAKAAGRGIEHGAKATGHAVGKVVNKVTGSSNSGAAHEGAGETATHP